MAVADGVAVVLIEAEKLGLVVALASVVDCELLGHSSQ